MNLTKQDLLTRKKLISAEYHLEYDIVNKIEKYMYLLEDKLKPLFPDEAIDTKVPFDANPSIPRFILRDMKKNRFLEMSSDRAVIKMNITDKLSDNPKQGIDYFKVKCSSIYDTVIKIIDPKLATSSGVFSIQYTMNDIELADIRSIYINKFLNSKIKKPFLFHFNIAYQEENCFINYFCQEYQSIKFIIDKKITENMPEGTHVIHIRQTAFNTEITDQGLQIILNINNKPFTDINCNDMEHRTTLETIFKHAQIRTEDLEEFFS